jgi:hypothetical protein
VVIFIVVSVKIIVLEIVEVHWRKNFNGLKVIKKVPIHGTSFLSLSRVPLCLS